MKRIKKSTSKTVSLRVPEEFFNKWKAKAEIEGISLSDVVWSEITEKKGITVEQERFLVKAYLVASRVMDIVPDSEDSVDNKVLEVVKLWKIVNDELEELIVSLFGPSLLYSKKEKLPDEDAVWGEINPFFNEILKR